MAIAAQERLRGQIPDEIVDAAVAGLRRQLGTLEPVAQRRRQVTVLFADVGGFTAMSERLDAEDVASVMNALWTRLDAVVHAHGGQIDKHIGDAVMAIWGVEVSREDDPERAVRAALALQQELADIRDAHGHDANARDLAMRIGINTGPVLLGVVASTTEFTAMGDTVNVASRLEHAAPIGQVLISHDTYRHIRGVFDVQPREPLVVKGKAEPLRTYVVKRAKPRPFRVQSRGVEGVETSTVGRAEELDRLCSEYAAARVDPGVRLVTVVGDAGLGKSRLLYEFRNWIELRPEPVFVFSGRALLGREQQALGLMRDVLATRFDMLLSDPPPTVAAKLRLGLAPALSMDEADAVGLWLGFEFGHSDAAARLAGSPQFAAVARAHLFAWFASLTRDEPGVLLLEDLHWADSETLDVIERLAERDDMHLLIVGLARPTLHERRPDWAAGRTRIDLAALGPEACRALVRDVLQHVDGLPDELVELVVSRADGNPFYVEELVKMLIDDATIEVAATGEPWRVDVTRLDGLSVPSTLIGVLQARLDGLPGPERSALQRASVVGRVFWDGAVTALGDDDVVGTTTALDSSRNRELVHGRAPSTFTDWSEFAFKHALLRDVTYETVLLRDRPTLHSRAAAWLERTAGPRASEYREVIAHHLEQAGDAASAAALLHAAGTASTKVGNFAAAELGLRRAIELWERAGRGPDPAIYPTLVRTLRLLGKIDDADAIVAAALDDPNLPDDERARLHYERSVSASVRGDHEREADDLRRGKALVRPDDFSLRAALENGTGWLCLAVPDVDGARSAGIRALDLARSAGDAAQCARAEAVLAMVAVELGDLVSAQAHAEQELEHAVETGDSFEIANASGHLGVVHHLRGDNGELEHYRDAIRLYEHQLLLFRRLGARPTELLTLVNLAQLHLRLNDSVATRRLLHEAVAMGDLAGPVHMMLVLQVEADRRLTEGDLAGGLAILGHVRMLPEYSGTEDAEMRRILSCVATPPEEVERLLAAGATLDLDRVLAELAEG